MALFSAPDDSNASRFIRLSHCRFERSVQHVPYFAFFKLHMLFKHMYKIDQQTGRRRVHCLIHLAHLLVLRKDFIGQRRLAHFSQHRQGITLFFDEVRLQIGSKYPAHALRNFRQIGFCFRTDFTNGGNEMHHRLMLLRQMLESKA